jgi:hypothetical protein
MFVHSTLEETNVISKTQGFSKEQNVPIMFLVYYNHFYQFEK